MPSSSVRLPSPTQQIPWRGEVWRAHQCAYPGDSTGGSRRFSARYNRGADSLPEGTGWDEAYRAGLVWEALYTGLSYGVCLGEFTRHLSPTTLVQKLRALCLTQLRADLAVVLDCTNLAALGIAEDDLLRDGDYETGQALAQAARERGAEALLLPSATRIGENDARVLIVFPDTLRPGSAVRVVKTVRPTLAPPTEAPVPYPSVQHPLHTLLTDRSCGRSACSPQVPPALPPCKQA